MARCFYESTRAGGTAHRRNSSGGLRVIIRPHDDLAAVAGGDRVSMQHHVAADKGRAGVLYARVLALIIPADQYRPATRVTGDIDHRFTDQRYTRCEQIDRA